MWLGKYCQSVTPRQSVFYPRATVSRDEVSAGSSRVIIAQVIPSFTCPLLLLVTTTVPQLPASTIRTAEVKITEISPDCAQRMGGIDFQSVTIYCLPDHDDYLQLIAIRSMHNFCVYAEGGNTTGLRNVL
jgi:hypothetical protein